MLFNHIINHLFNVKMKPNSIEVKLKDMLLERMIFIINDFDRKHVDPIVELDVHYS